MAIISTTFNYLYLLAPGAASTTISRYLLEFCDGRWLPNEDILDENGFFLVQKSHSTVEQLLQNQLLPEEELGKLLKFTAVRNPFDEMVSEWHRSRTAWLDELRNPNSWVFKAEGKLDQIIFAAKYDFPDWIEIILGKSYERGFKTHLYKDYIQNADYIIRIESLEDDLKVLFHKLGIAYPNQLESKNVNLSKTQPYWQYYNRRAREIVSQVFEPDLVKFGYIF